MTSRTNLNQGYQIQERYQKVVIRTFHNAIYDNEKSDECMSHL